MTVCARLINMPDRLKFHGARSDRASLTSCRLLKMSVPCRQNEVNMVDMVNIVQCG
jgi:hypothetical protein